MTSVQALAHPWFARMKQQPPGVTCSNNVLPLKKSVGHTKVIGGRVQQQGAKGKQRRQRLATGSAPVTANQQSVMRVGRSYPSPSAVGSLAF